jgi:outer membrane protein
MFKKCIAALVALPIMASAQNVMTVEDAIRISLENNFSIKIAERNQQIFENNTTLGNAGFLPIISLQGATTYGRNNVRQQFINGELNVRPNALNFPNTANLSLDWTIFDGLGMFIAREQLEEFRKAGMESAQITIQNTVAQVSGAYYNIIQQQEKVEAFADALRISEERLELAKAQYEVGSGSKLNYLAAQVDYNTDKSALILQEQLLQNAKVTLNELLSREAGLDFAVSDTIMVDPSMNFSDLKYSALQRNPNLLLAQRNQKIAQLDVRALNAQRLPRIVVNADYNYSYLQSQAGFLVSNRSAGYSFGATGVLPIFNGFNQTRLIQNARIQQNITELQLSEVRVQIEADLQRAFNDYQNSLALIQQNVEIALERYKLGVSTPLELREVQRNAVATESRLIEAAFNAKIAEIELNRLSNRILQ